MTVLLVDLGNTRCKYAWSDTPERVQYAQSIPALLNDIGDAPVRRLICSTTAGHDALAMLSAAWPQALCQRVVPRDVIGLRLAYADTLGVDRFVAMLALADCGWQRENGSIVVDAGTAMTIDVVGSNGAHQGGLIMPGLRLALESLNRGTANLPAVDRAAQVAASPLGRDTEACIRQGCEQQLLSTMLRMTALASAEQCVLTGGDADRLYELLSVNERQQWRLEPAWVLLGLKKILDLGPDAHTILSTYNR